MVIAFVVAACFLITPDFISLVRTSHVERPAVRGVLAQLAVHVDELSCVAPWLRNRVAEPIHGRYSAGVTTEMRSYSRPNTHARRSGRAGGGLA